MPLSVKKRAVSPQVLLFQRLNMLTDLSCRAALRLVTPQNPIKEPVKLWREWRHLSSGREGNMTPSSVMQTGTCVRIISLNVKPGHPGRHKQGLSSHTAGNQRNTDTLHTHLSSKPHPGDFLAMTKQWRCVAFHTAVMWLVQTSLETSSKANKFQRGSIQFEILIQLVICGC